MKKWSVVVIIDGYTLKAVGDGTEEGTVFEGRDKDIAMAKAAIFRGWSIALGFPRFSPIVKASYDSALGLTAALMGAGSSPAVLWRAPKDVMKFIEDYQNEHNYEKKLYGGKANC
jgi:hypothetical protein